MPPSKYVPTLNAANNTQSHPTTRLNSLVQTTLTALGYLNTKFDHSEDSFAHGAPATTTQNHPHTAH